MRYSIDKRINDANHLLMQTLTQLSGEGKISEEKIKPFRDRLIAEIEKHMAFYQEKDGHDE